MLLSYPAGLALSDVAANSVARYQMKHRVIAGTFLRKRLFDVLFAGLVVLFLLSWLIPLIALLIKLESKGPTFFKQQRTGKNGKPFYCLKFRSMTMNADADVLQASKGDRRVTRIGALLRASSFDELPQFLNVLRGDMSIVGPRPHMLRHTADYSKTIHNFMERHMVLPGITGLAQVAGYRGETKELSAMENRVNADIYYLRNWSFWLDMKIVALTVFQVAKQDENVF